MEPSALRVPQFHCSELTTVTVALAAVQTTTASTLPNRRNLPRSFGLGGAMRLLLSQGSRYLEAVCGSWQREGTSVALRARARDAPDLLVEFAPTPFQAFCIRDAEADPPAQGRRVAPGRRRVALGGLPTLIASIPGATVAEQGGLPLSSSGERRPNHACETMNVYGSLVRMASRMPGQGQPVVISMAICLSLGCAPPVTLVANGTQHKMSASDAEHAEQLAARQPPGCAGGGRECCEYWTLQESDAESEDKGNSNSLAGWIGGRRADACFGIQPRAASGQSTTLSLSTSRAKDSEETRNAKPEPTAEERQARARAIADEEIRSGRCNETKVNHLREVLQGVRQVLDSEGRSSGQLYDVRSHEFVVATPEGAELALSPLVGGEYHLIAFQYSRTLRMGVTDRAGYPIKTQSPQLDGVAGLWAHQLAWDSRVMSVNDGEKIKIEIKGDGCTLVVAVLKV